MGPFRPASTRNSRQRSSSTSSTASAASNVPSTTEEDLDLIANATVSDGFRSLGTASSNVPYTPPGSLLPPPQAINPSFSRWNHRPSSVTKHPRPHESLTIRADGSNAAANANQNLGNGSSSLSSGAAYHSPSNPLHSYGNAANRNARGNRFSYTGPHRPSHPYTLYPQGTAATPVEANQQLIPVGFNGLNASYERQIGPDGEEVGDLLGPLCHTEELPPYSRYPQVAFTAKNIPHAIATSTATATPVTAAPVPAQSNQHGVSSGSEQVVAAPFVSETESHTVEESSENPFASAEDALVSTNSRLSLRSLASYRDDPCEPPSSEKPPRFQTKWQRRARTKLWGIIPYWSICLVFVGMIIMGTVMGVVVATVLSKGSNQNASDVDPDYVLDSDSTIIDIKSVSTVPPSLSPLPTGSFSLPQLDGGSTKRYCMNDASQLAAWSCNMAFRSYNMEILDNFNESSTERYNISIKPINRAQSQFLRGTHPPLIDDPIPLRLTLDNEDQDKLAYPWWVTVTYNKTVIAPKQDLNQVQKRGLVYSGPEDGMVADIELPSYAEKMSQTQSGDFIWICTWPQTILDIFVYPGQNMSAMTTTTTTSNTPAATGFASADDDEMTPFTLPPYPRLMRMVERRNSNSGAASCRKYLIPDQSDSAIAVTGPDGAPIEILISEMMASMRKHSPSHHVHGRGESVRRTLEDEDGGLMRRDVIEFTPCSCLWRQ